MALQVSLGVVKGASLWNSFGGVGGIFSTSLAAAFGAISFGISAADKCYNQEFNSEADILRDNVVSIVSGASGLLMLFSEILTPEHDVLTKIVNVFNTMAASNILTKATYDAAQVYLGGESSQAIDIYEN